MHPQHPHVSPVSLQPSTPAVPDASSPPKVPYFNGAAAVVPPPRQKGRPRKRKPKDLEAMTASLGECSDFNDFGIAIERKREKKFACQSIKISKIFH